MFTGQCRLVWECPSCGKVYGGVSEGGILKLCEWCPQKGVCDVNEEEDTLRAERLCQSVECILAQVLNGHGHAKI